MARRVIVVENDDGWSVYDAVTGERLKDGFETVKDVLKVCRENNFETPPRTRNDDFFADMDGKPLFITRPSKSGGIELEYSDGTPCLDFEICSVCNGPAFGRNSRELGRNCYYCTSCHKDVDCVPPEEWIGELD